MIQELLKFRVARTSVSVHSCILLTLTLSACTNGVEPSGALAEQVNRSDWETVCLGHLTMQLPAHTTFGAHPVELGSVAKLEGIGNGDFGGWLRYGGMEVTESTPNPAKGLRTVQTQAIAKIPTSEEYELSIKARRDEVRNWQENVAESNDDIARSVLRDKQAALANSITASRVSGEAKVNGLNEFAIRRNNEFIVGFRDDVDSRIRVFSGQLTSLEPANPKAAALQLQQLRKQYQVRLPSTIPSSPGFCTAFGFLNEPSQPVKEFEFRLPIQLSQYPNLVFYIEMTPGQLVNPNESKGIFDKNAVYAMMTPSGVKKRHGPHSVKILGMHGTKIAREYGPICSKEGGCAPADRAYAFQAELPGEEGRADRPRLTLHMSALYANVPEKSETSKEPRRWSAEAELANPALTGHTPPPFEVGKAIFERVLNSIHVRPGAFAISENRTYAQK